MITIREEKILLHYTLYDGPKHPSKGKAADFKNGKAQKDRDPTMEGEE
jgi:hypothetical protein